MGNKNLFNKYQVFYIGIGLVFGVAIGAALENIGAGVAIGMIFGFIVSQFTKK